MGFFKQGSIMEGLRTEYPEKFTSADKAFKNIQRGNKIYIGTAAGEPKHLVRSLMEYLNQNPQAFFDVDIYHVWTLLDDSDVFFEKYKRNFRIKSFFIGDTNRDAINKGDADYTPVFTPRTPACLLLFIKIYCRAPGFEYTFQALLKQLTPPRLPFVTQDGSLSAASFRT
jgi:acyl-CoA hydrolase